MKRLRLGIAGCGLAAGGLAPDGRSLRANHARAARAVEDVELCAAADVSTERLQSFGKHWDVTRLYSDVDRMVRSEALDLLSVATPADTHEAVCLEALDAGVRGILCEKPLTGTHAGAARIVQACREKGCALVVNFTRRWDQAHQAATARIAAGDLGPVRSVTGHYTGTLRGNGAHFLDTLRMLVPGTWRVAWSTGLAKGEDDGPLSVLLVDENGARAFLSPVEAAAYFVFEIHVFGQRGRLRLLEQGNDVRLDLPRASRDNPGYFYLADAEQIGHDSLSQGFAQALATLVDAVKTGREVGSGADSVETLRLVEDCILHAKEHA